MNEEIMYDFLMHYNPYAKQWCIFHRDDKENYFNGKPFKYPHLKGAVLEDMLEEMFEI